MWTFESCIMDPTDHTSAIGSGGGDVVVERKLWKAIPYCDRHKMEKVNKSESNNVPFHMYFVCRIVYTRIYFKST